MRKTDEEKVAEAIHKLLSDLRLDLDQVGVYIGRIRPQTSQRRLEIILEAAEEERNGVVDYDRFNQDTLF
jgi:predicted RNA binding protein with dsRBD fold (UPF0201 family)